MQLWDHRGSTLHQNACPVMVSVPLSCKPLFCHASRHAWLWVHSKPASCLQVQSISIEPLTCSFASPTQQRAVQGGALFLRLCSSALALALSLPGGGKSLASCIRQESQCSGVGSGSGESAAFVGPSEWNRIQIAPCCRAQPLGALPKSPCQKAWSDLRLRRKYRPMPARSHHAADGIFVVKLLQTSKRPLHVPCLNRLKEAKPEFGTCTTPVFAMSRSAHSEHARVKRGAENTPRHCDAYLVDSQALEGRQVAARLGSASLFAKQTDHGRSDKLYNSSQEPSQTWRMALGPRLLHHPKLRRGRGEPNHVQRAHQHLQLQMAVGTSGARSHGCCAYSAGYYQLQYRSSAAVATCEGMARAREC